VITPQVRHSLDGQPYSHVGGASTIAQTDISAAQQAISHLIFALIGTLGVGIPVGIYSALGARSEKLLAGLKNWMSPEQRRHHDRPVPDHRRQTHRRRDRRLTG
jgi:hypothetical protein